MNGKTIVSILRPDFSSTLPLTYVDSGIPAGFPSPADEFISDTIDLNQHLINHPTSTFYARVVGDSMSGEGIDTGDLLIVDRSLEPADGDLAVCCLDGEFTLKRISINANSISLVPSNPAYNPIEISPDDNFTVWGIVTHTIKSNRRRRH